MITVERRVQTDSALPVVFAYLSDFTHTEQWDPGTVRTTRTDEGELGVGATFHNVSTFRGRQTELDYCVVRYDPDEHLTFTGVNKTVEATDDMSFGETGADDDSEPEGGTVVTYRAHFAFSGWASGVALRMLTINRTPPSALRCALSGKPSFSAVN